LIQSSIASPNNNPSIHLSNNDSSNHPSIDHNLSIQSSTHLPFDDSSIHLTSISPICLVSFFINPMNRLSYLTTSVVLPPCLSEFSDIFSEASANQQPPHRPYDCEIKLKPNATLFYDTMYPITEPESNSLEKYIEENLRKGFIRKSKSLAGVPILFVKKNGELRLCIDYRHLNDITIKDLYPLTLIQDILEHLGVGKIFTSLDLRSAYNLVRIKSGDEYKTVFTCKLSHFEYTVRPFGLKNAPAIFQHFINDVLEDILGKYVFAYIDDIIFSSDATIHKKHMLEFHSDV